MAPKIINHQQLFKMVLNKKPLNTTFPEIDHSKPFIHDHLTQLYHSPFYDILDAAQKLRYNQLFALRTTEQLMTLEESFIGKVLKRARADTTIRSNQALVHCMEEMAQEETTHYHMFRTLNQKTEPDIYRHDEMFFARHTTSETILLKGLTITPGILQLLVWIVLILEEFSIYISRQMLNKNDTENLEYSFILAHREHLKDESRHVHICANILDILCKKSTGTKRFINAQLLNHFMREYLTPKHGGLRVLNKLIEEFPELSQHKETLTRGIYESRYKQPIWHALADPSAMPVTYMMFERFPVYRLNVIQNVILPYEREQRHVR